MNKKRKKIKNYKKSKLNKNKKNYLSSNSHLKKILLEELLNKIKKL